MKYRIVRSFKDGSRDLVCYFTRSRTIGKHGETETYGGYRYALACSYVSLQETPKIFYSLRTARPAQSILSGYWNMPHIIQKQIKGQWVDVNL